MAADRKLVGRLAVKLLTPIAAAAAGKAATVAAERLRDARPPRDLVNDLAGRVPGTDSRTPVPPDRLEQRRKERAEHRAARRKSSS